jgi:hypothetical protein
MQATTSAGPSRRLGLVVELAASGWEYALNERRCACAHLGYVGLTAAFVIGLFIWGALKDGEEDKAVQARLGIRRRTRLGR